MATKPVHEFTRAKIPDININCGLNILRGTSTEPLGQTSPWTSKSTWTPISTTEFPTTTTLFNRRPVVHRPRPKPILEISNENLSEDLTTKTTQLTKQLTTQLTTQLTSQIVLLITQTKGVSSTDEEHLPGKPIIEKPFPEEPEEEQLDQSSSHFKIIYDLKTFVMHFILIILCFQ